MTGPEHYAEAERLLALADRHTRGVTYEQDPSPDSPPGPTLSCGALRPVPAGGQAAPVGRCR
jgi:hypothetical protein